MGHECAIVTGMDYAQVLADNGLTRIPRTAKDGSSFEIPMWGKPLGVAMQTKHIEFAVSAFRPDVIVTTHLVLGALIVAEKVDLPVFVLGSSCYMWPAKERLMRLGAETEAESSRIWHYEEQLRIYNACRAALGLREAESTMKSPALAGDMLMVRSAPEVFSDFDALPRKVSCVGDCLWEPSVRDSDLDEWLDAHNGVPIAYVQLGRSFEFPSNWPVVRECLRNNGFSIVTATARSDKAIPDYSETSGIFSRPHILQSHVLERPSTMVVTTGHPTATLGAVTRACQLIMLPNGSGTQENAEAYSRAGAAMVIPSTDLTVTKLSSALDRLKDNVKAARQRETVRSWFDVVRSTVSPAETILQAFEYGAEKVTA